MDKVIENIKMCTGIHEAEINEISNIFEDDVMFKRIINDIFPKLDISSIDGDNRLKIYKIQNAMSCIEFNIKTDNEELLNIIYSIKDYLDKDSLSVMACFILCNKLNETSFPKILKGGYSIPLIMSDNTCRYISIYLEQPSSIRDAYKKVLDIITCDIRKSLDFMVLNAWKIA